MAVSYTHLDVYKRQMYYPDTVVIVTADHETGALQFVAGIPQFTNLGYHTGNNVPVYAYGSGTEAFSSGIVENTDCLLYTSRCV